MARMPIGVYLTVSTAGRMPWLIAMSFQGAAVFEHDYAAFLLSAAACSLLASVAFFKRVAICNWVPNRPASVCVETVGHEDALADGSSARRETS
jgi:hypothetical protein